MRNDNHGLAGEGTGQNRAIFVWRGREVEASRATKAFFACFFGLLEGNLLRLQVRYLRLKNFYLSLRLFIRQQRLAKVLREEEILRLEERYLRQERAALSGADKSDGVAEGIPGESDAHGQRLSKLADN